MLVEKTAGAQAQFLDEQYRAAGAILVDRDELFNSTDIMLKVRPPIFGQEAEKVKEGSTLVSFLYPNQNKEIVEALEARKATVFAMEMIPRISRAQVFDALRCVAAIYIPKKRAQANYTAPWPTSQGTRRFSRQPIISDASLPVRSRRQGELSCRALLHRV